MKAVKSYVSPVRKSKEESIVNVSEAYPYKVS
jgi:hypothetical protein